MGDRRRSLSHGHHSSEAEGGPDWGQDDDALGVQGAVFGSPGTKDTTCLDDEELSFEDREAETLPEEVTEGEPPGPRAPEEALEPLERVLEKDAEGIPEMRWAPRSGARGRGRGSGGRAAAPARPQVPPLWAGGLGDSRSLASEAGASEHSPVQAEGGLGLETFPETRSQGWRLRQRGKQAGGSPGAAQKLKPFQVPASSGTVVTGGLRTRGGWFLARCVSWKEAGAPSQCGALRCGPPACPPPALASLSRFQRERPWAGTGGLHVRSPWPPWNPAQPPRPPWSLCDKHTPRPVVWQAVAGDTCRGKKGAGRWEGPRWGFRPGAAPSEGTGGRLSPQHPIPPAPWVSRGLAHSRHLMHAHEI